MKPKQVFERVYHGRTSTVTPHALKYGVIRKCMAYEISAGSFSNGDPIYGLTFINICNDGTLQPNYILSRPFLTMEEVKKYLQKVRKMLKNKEANHAE